MNIILCGFHWTGCEALRILREEGHSIFVYTHEAPYHVPNLAGLCEKWGIPYSMENISTAKLPFQPDAICSIYYRYIIKPEVISSCNGRIFNLHPALLPHYRGCSSLTWALINGEKNVGYTFHYIDEGCDTGNVLLQREIEVKDWDSQLTLYQRVMYEAMKEFRSALWMVLRGEEGKVQKGEGSYYKRGCPYEGVIDPSWSVEKIERFIRAMYFPPYPAAKYNEKEVLTFDEYQKLRTEGQ